MDSELGGGDADESLGWIVETNWANRTNKSNRTYKTHTTRDLLVLRVSHTSDRVPYDLFVLDVTQLCRVTVDIAT